MLNDALSSVAVVAALFGGGYAIHELIMRTHGNVLVLAGLCSFGLGAAIVAVFKS